jgi:hypothetical protein
VQKEEKNGKERVSNMDEKSYAQFLSMKDRELFDFVTEKDSSQRKWAAIYILETRKARISSRAAIAAAVAAGFSALAALIQVFW